MEIGPYAVVLAGFMTALGILVFLATWTPKNRSDRTPKCPKCGNTYAWKPWAWMASKGGPEPHTCEQVRNGCGYSEDYDMAANRMAAARQP